MLEVGPETAEEVVVVVAEMEVGDTFAASSFAMAILVVTTSHWDNWRSSCVVRLLSLIT